MEEATREHVRMNMTMKIVGNTRQHRHRYGHPTTDARLEDEDGNDLDGSFDGSSIDTTISKARAPAAEARKHKLKTLVPAPRSFFMDVKCPGCFTITTVFSHAQTVVICQGCTTVLCQPTGGKARLTEGCSFRRK
ncbi:hypothetical protein SPBR_09092 [Sporothrix brasiliensis 5110]|uniref:40S ribosomal protein S27 n=1 Tax=Sporothrix brasiliensis 5110 TaxID=1398154 RepID=A0A0C2FKJ2_9PEZI|nr:uncharacterized protein SPBR_09092 [Sporothrix brasiliensis 5110]KIH91603.1 hypothetical protein SPBR_09092 [Sporothrix brasiliensis 5110]